MAELNKAVAVQEITVDDGTTRVPIKNRQGQEIGVFYFRPTDINLIKRYNEIADKFDDIVAPLENINIANDGTAADDDAASIAAINDAEKRLYGAIDYLFGGNMSEAFFGSMNPFSPVNGHFYCESAINAVGVFIQNQFAAETKKVNAKVASYTSPYMQGHRKKQQKGRR